MEYSLDSLPPLEVYRLLTDVIVPRPIAWVTSHDAQGALNAAPFSYFNILGTDPPIVAIGVSGRRDGSWKDTGANIEAVGSFVVNLVDESLATAMNVTAIDFPREVNELVEAGLTTVPSVHVSVPRIAEAKVHLECRLVETRRYGNNRVVVGEVVHLHIRDGETPDSLHLIGRLHGRGWYTRTTDRFEMGRIPLSEWQSTRKE